MMDGDKVQNQEILEELKRIVLNYFNSPKIKIYLFGSWATGENRTASDIDLAIWYDKPLPPGTVSMLRYNIEESNIPYRVDIVDLTCCDKRFQKAVLEEGLEWTG